MRNQNISVDGNSCLESIHETEENCNMTPETELNVFKQTLGYEKHLESQIQKLRLEKRGRNEIKVARTQKRNRIKW